jgi:MSHA biogenesis protein MshO
MRRAFNPGYPRSAGFTLVEMISVIAITGAIAGAVAVFIRSPVQGYIDSVRRAELTDVADTALRRMARDLRNSLPNSVRVTSAGAVTYLEFLEVRTGGRYRADTDNSGSGDPLIFSSADTAFDTLNPLSALADETIVAGDRVVIYNLGIPGADAYNGDNTSVISATGAGALANENRITFASKLFPFASPGNRFHVISGPVTYACDTVAGTLTRYWGYTIAATQPAPPAGASTAVLAGDAAAAADPARVAGCQFVYSANAVAQRNGLVLIDLQLTKRSESVRLLQQAHVSNIP